MWRDKSTTGTSVARILGLWVLYFSGNWNHRRIHPTLQTGRDLRLSGSVRQRQEPPCSLIRTITFSRKVRALYHATDG